MNPLLAKEDEAALKRARLAEIYPPSMVRTIQAAAALSGIEHGCGVPDGLRVEFNPAGTAARMTCTCGWKSKSVAL